MKYQLKGVYITSYSVNGSAESDTPDSFEFKDAPTKGDSYTATDDLWFKDTQGESRADPLPAEDFTMNYTKVEWTYDEGTAYTASDDLFI